MLFDLRSQLDVLFQTLDSVNKMFYYSDADFDANKYLFEIKHVPEKDVILWHWHDVKIWAHLCGFIELHILKNIENKKIQGSELLNDGITYKMLGITDPWDISKFHEKIRALKSRHIREKSRIPRLIRREEQYIETMRIKRKIEEENKQQENDEVKEDGSVASLSSLEDEGSEQEDVQTADEQDTMMTKVGYTKCWKYESHTVGHKIIKRKVEFWRELGPREKRALEDGSPDSSHTK